MRDLAGLPDAMASADLAGRLEGRRPAVFLDYDGTLTPIVDHPERARLEPSMREVLRRLASRCPVAVVSGRDRREVQRLLGMEDLVVVGSHGFEIWVPGRGTVAPEVAAPHRHSVEEAVARLRRELADVPGAVVEPKAASVAVHYRLVPEQLRPRVRAAVAAVATASGGRLRLTHGRMVHELQPNVEWDKGRAVLYLLHILDLDRDEVVPVYLGDDLTDEDAFRVLADRGLGILVGDPRDPELAGRTTWARYRLSGVAEVRRFLERLAGWLEAGPEGPATALDGA